MKAMEPAEFLATVARCLVSDPAAVTVTEVDGGAVLELRVAPNDIGRTIGRDGAHIHALRWLLGAVAARAGKRGPTLELMEDP